MEFGEWSKLALLYIIHNLLLAQCIVHLETKLGRIKGTHMYSRDGRKFHAFLGVPFAEPPIGELRFQVSYQFLCNHFQYDSYISVLPQVFSNRSSFL